MNLSRDMHGASLVMEHHSIVLWQLNLHSWRNLPTFCFDIKFRTSASSATFKVIRLAHLRTFVSDVIWNLLFQVSCTVNECDVRNVQGLRIDTVFVTLEINITFLRLLTFLPLLQSDILVYGMTSSCLRNTIVLEHLLQIFTYINGNVVTI